MQNDSKRVLIRWAGSTLRLNLSDREMIMGSTESAILIGLNGHPNKLIATHAFHPAILGSGLQLVELQHLIIGNFGAHLIKRKDIGRYPNGFLV